MALKDKWVDKINEVDDVDANDINTVANAVIEVEGKLDGFEYGVKYKPQSLTEEQKAQARKNIDALGIADISLGIAPDGLIYVFINGVPVGTGIPQGQSGDVFGYVDENNTIVLNGNLADGTYTIKYEMEDGSTVDIGNLVLDTNVYYSVTNNLTNCANSNSAITAVEGESYSATITANDGYELSSVSVTMGGSPVSVSGGIINISNVTGNIVITAVATEVQTNDPDNILTNGAYTVELNKRWSASAKAYSTCNGMICITIPTADVLNTTNKKIYFKGFTKDLKASNNPPIWIAIDANLTKVGTIIGAANSNLWGATGLTDEGNGVYSVVVNNNNFERVSSSTYLKLNMAVNASDAVTSLDGLTMTIDKPIS